MPHRISWFPRDSVANGGRREPRRRVKLSVNSVINQLFEYYYPNYPELARQLR